MENPKHLTLTNYRSGQSWDHRKVARNRVIRTDGHLQLQRMAPIGHYFNLDGSDCEHMTFSLVAGDTRNEPRRP